LTAFVLACGAQVLPGASTICRWPRRTWIRNS